MRYFAAFETRARRWVQEQVTLRRQEAVIQSAKMALAAVVAWMLALQVDQAQSFIAPYVAVFLISQTIYRSLVDALRQVASLVLGVVLAFTVVTLISNQVVALAIAVFMGVLLGQAQWFRESGVWVGVVALLMVTSYTADNAGFLFYRVIESLIGAAVGTAVNLLVLPPVHLRQAERVVADVSAEITRLLESMATGVRQPWRDWDTAAWLDQARAVDRTVYRAREAVGRGYESTRFNPEWRTRSDQERRTPAACWSAIETLAEVTRQVQRMSEALASANRAGGVVWQTDNRFNRNLADLMESLVGGVERYRSPQSEEKVYADISRCLELTEELARDEGERDTGSGWSAHGALLVALERAFQALEEDIPAR